MMAQKCMINAEQWPLLLVCLGMFFSPTTLKWSPRSLSAVSNFLLEAVFESFTENCDVILRPLSLSQCKGV